MLLLVIVRLRDDRIQLCIGFYVVSAVDAQHCIGRKRDQTHWTLLQFALGRLMM